jgi:hypothetical protein
MPSVSTLPSTALERLAIDLSRGGTERRLHDVFEQSAAEARSP